MTEEKIIQKIEEQHISWIQIHFTDLSGTLRVVHFPAKQFIEDNILKNGCGFDGSSVGLKTVEKSDMLAVPDPNTFLVLPNNHNEARLIADVYDTTHTPCPIDPRNTLKKTITYAASHGYQQVNISPEMEFFVLSSNQENNIKTKANDGYFTPPPLDNAKPFRKKISEMLLQSGIKVKYHHHENGRYQHEIEVKALPAIAAADFSMYFKYLARHIASTEDLQVTFMPKLFEDEAGNGMHAHLSLFNDNKNCFYDEQDKRHLSTQAKYFIGGILHHAKSIAAFANPTMNSYKRLIPHFEAPLYIAWGQYNRSSLIRIAAKKNIDVEVRNADPSANPYLFFSALIYAGIDGIKKEISYKPIEKNIYHMSEEEIKNEGIEKLPQNLFEALAALENDVELNRLMGKDLIDAYISNKKEECQNYLREVSDVDVDFYFNV